jgi:ribosomal protein S12 methylthiotransferase accessory factor
MTAFGYRDSARIVGSGAGLTWDAASGAALGECLERYCAAMLDPGELVYGSFEELRARGNDACDPEAFALFDPSQEVPYPSFTRKTRIAWSRGWWLANGAPAFVPGCFAYLSTDSSLREFGSALIGPAISTGCACARNMEEALLYGLYELIERDAFMIAWRNCLSLPEVIIDPASDLSAVFISRFSRPGLEFRIWQTTLDLGIPSFLGMLTDRRGTTSRMIVGGSANHDPERAVLKTLCELTQGLSWLDSGEFNEEDANIKIDDIHTFTDRARFYASVLRENAFSFLRQGSDVRPLSSISSLKASVSERLSVLVAKLVAEGLRPLAIDLSTPDVREAGFIVSRVIIPGLETMEGDHRLQMLGGRRWREVPVKLNILPEETCMENINPYPHPYP